MISQNKCTGSCNVLFPKICVSKETKDINVKGFNTLTNKNEAKTTTKHISCDCKCKFNSITCNSNQKWNNKTCQCERKIYHKWKKDYSWNPSTCIYEKSKSLKSIVDNSVIECDEIITVVDILSIEKTNTIAANVTSTASINCYSKKKGLLYFGYSFISDYITINNYHDLLSLCKTKKH